MSAETPEDLSARAASGFSARFGGAPDAVAFAPGRVNLLGEHTDYNGGFVLPMPLALGTAVAVGPEGTPGRIRVASEGFESEEERDIGERATGAWSDYILGCLAAQAAEIVATSGLRVFVASNLPVGAGLSSSAAIEVATIRAVHALTGRSDDPIRTAIAAREVENAFVGMPCGIMDQFAVSVGSIGQALFLDTRRLEYRKVDLPVGYRIVVIHSGVSHRLTDDGYSTRVAECNAAAGALGVDLLSDLSPADLDRISHLPAPLAARARHVVTENQRVLDAVEALRSNDAAAFAALMVASHASQRDDYAVSLPEIDRLVETALDLGAVGARLTGGGFGGSVVALVEASAVPDLCAAVQQRREGARVLSVT